MDVVAELTQALTRFGPAVLGVMTLLETSSLFGLFVPAGVAFLLASFLATQGTFSLKLVVAWAVAGALVGDSVGYWVGRRSSPVDYGRSRGGLLGRALAQLGPKKLKLLAGSPFYSISLARVVSFLRTLAPMAAGAAGIRYPRFLAYNLGGIVLWATSLATVGAIAGESWKRAGQYMGAFWGVIFLATILIGLWMRRLRRGAPVAEPVFSVGLTGNAASGKSTVAGLWRGQGVPVVDADRLAREAVEAGSAGLVSVVSAFGEGVLSADGTLDREQLRGIVFENAEKRLQLESILHPIIARLRAEWVTAQAAAGEKVVVSEIPLLFETDLASEFDVIVLVHSPREVSHKRLVEARGLAPAQADAVLDAQMPSEDKQEKSDYVILNIGSKRDLEERAMHILGELRARARNAAGVDR